ncbi:MAG: histidine phosphatase family protein [Arthrobacter sp.]|jgi:broad specificity phosphatase PhoE|nr:histidine phosphatase family protein [Arthrobacter sp.]
MSVATVHLVRHGEVHNPGGVLYGRLPHFGLSEKGHAMARMVADHFTQRAEQGHRVVRLVASPLQRAQETAAPLSEALGLEVIEEPRVIEAFSRLEGLDKIAVRLRNPKRWPLLRNPLRPSWGESYADQVTRVAGAVKEHREAAVAEAGDGAEVVIVSHQLPIWVTRVASEGRSLGLNAFRRECTLASVTSLTFTDGELTELNYTEPAASLLPGTINIPGA